MIKEYIQKIARPLAKGMQRVAWVVQDLLDWLFQFEQGYKHGFIAVIMVMVSAAIMQAVFTLDGAILFGVWSASVFFYARELSQYQTKLSKQQGVPRSSLWMRGWFVYNWDKHQIAQFIIPVLFGLAFFAFVQFFER